MRAKRILLIVLCAVGIPAIVLPSLLWDTPEAAPHAALRITEVMSSNVTALQNADGQYYDWVEVTNTGSAALSLADMALTDDPNEPQAFAFGEQTLAGGESVVVPLTGNAAEARPGYAPFALSGGDTLYLYRGDTVVHSLTVAESPDDLSFGLYESEYVWFASPTPGTANGGLHAATVPALREACRTGIQINEVCAVSRDSDRVYPTDWIELKNTADHAVELGGYRLTENATTSFTLPTMTLEAGGFVLITCDEQAIGELCAPFSLSPYGETLTLLTPDGVVCDTFDSGKQRYGISSGRPKNGTLERVYFTLPTPSAENGAGVDGYAATPTADRHGGYAEVSATVSLTVPTGCRVYYTTDGSVPTEQDTRYTAPLTVTKTTVLRAVAYRDGYLPSDVLTETYLLTDKHTLPVVSVTGEPSALFGAGGAFTDYLNENKEAAVHTEFFEADGGKAAAFDSLLRISGGLSRYNVQKAFSLNLNQTVGTTSVSYPFFRHKATEEFGNLLLRPSGSDWSSAKLRDEFVAAALEDDPNFAIQGVRPVALYINGAYHGLYYLREKRNEAFVAAETGIPEEYVEIGKAPALYESHLPMNSDMKALVAYARTHDLRVEEHYRYVTEHIDKASLMRYYAAQTWFGNGDVINNTAYYRDTRDGKWHWIVFDMDWACTSYYAEHEFIKQLYDGGVHTYRNYYDPLMTALLKNEEFALEFVKTYKQLMETTLSSERLLPILDELAAEIENEIPRQHARYGAPSVAKWKNQIEYMRNFIRGRDAVITQQLCEVFSLSDEDWNRL